MTLCSPDTQYQCFWRTCCLLEGTLGLGLWALKRLFSQDWNKDRETENRLPVYATRRWGKKGRRTIIFNYSLPQWPQSLSSLLNCNPVMLLLHNVFCRCTGSKERCLSDTYCQDGDAKVAAALMHRKTHYRLHSAGSIPAARMDMLKLQQLSGIARPIMDCILLVPYLLPGRICQSCSSSQALQDPLRIAFCWFHTYCQDGYAKVAAALRHRKTHYGLHSAGSIPAARMDMPQHLSHSTNIAIIGPAAGR
jgi:hypothetical protein